MKKSMRKKAPSPPGGALPGVSEEREDKPKAAAAAPPKPPAEKNKYSSGESSEEEEDTREMEGNVYTKSGVEVSTVLYYIYCLSLLSLLRLSIYIYIWRFWKRQRARVSEWVHGNAGE